LGVDFYIRLLVFGAVPVLTWLAYQFPEIWGAIYRFIQPGLGVIEWTKPIPLARECGRSLDMDR
jgi:hypothetical protein